LRTKLYIPYHVGRESYDEFLVVRSNLKIGTLATFLVSKLLTKGLTQREWLALFWLGERLKPLARAKIYYLLTLERKLPRKQGIYFSFKPWFWSHQNLEKAFPALRGDLMSQASRLLKNGKVQFQVERRENKIKPRELRWMGVGYRDSGSLTSYNFTWKDIPSDEVQVIFQDLFARLTDSLLQTHIERARRDLRDFRVKVPSSKKRAKPSDENQGVGSKLESFSRARIFLMEVERILPGN
jgi:hypothetical protein